MTRYHSTPKGQIPFTPEEDAAEDALQADYLTRAQERKTVLTRQERNRLLAESDWVSLRALDASSDGLVVQVPAGWVAYRQALRDITKQPSFPDEVTWPQAPQ